jgi:F0F1-type ATP synthase beta subunit
VCSSDLGQFVSVEDTVKGFKEILDGKHDDIPEQAFLMCGKIYDVIAKAQKMAAEAA